MPAVRTWILRAQAGRAAPAFGMAREPACTTTADAMEFQHAFERWKRAHQAAYEAECRALRFGLTPAGAQELQNALALRREASQALRAMLAASAVAAAACRPAPPLADPARASPRKARR
ncbi:hypothetical protein DES41_103139 [Pseudorhodoferax soli]|uniref:Uncharacterized protein n=2 Tax=Pseudorhodoferax soli TaxID=545864 RepID=A0A368XX34_9BURK|nr:hypothetical protein DES41_103139 [Pseudorhodoferax soli]